VNFAHQRLADGIMHGTMARNARQPRQSIGADYHAKMTFAPLLIAAMATMGLTLIVNIQHFGIECFF